jgi:branched-chain amino acid transport system substrate-binding protein
MPLTRRGLLGSAAVAGLTVGRAARAQGATVKIGVLTDLSGPYRDDTGPGSVACAQQAAAEFGSGHGFGVQVLSADHQNKPNIGAGIARQWFDRDGVDMILDVPTSSVALAVNSIAKERNKAYVNTGAGTADLTGTQCTPVTVHWSYDTYMLSRSTASQLVRLGGKKWFFVTADYVFGQQLERDASNFVKQSGGQVLGHAPYPFPETTDFSSYLIQAQSSGADVVGFASAGADMINAVKQSHEFGLAPRMRLAALLAHPADVVSIGPELAQGLYLTASFYWDLNDRTRAFTKRVLDKMPRKQPPNMIQAGCYAGTLHYLKAVAGMGADKAKASGAATVAKMKSMATDDDAFGRASIREDGLVLLPAYLLQAKPPGQIKQHWDVLNLVATTPPDQAWRPLGEGGCPLVKS